MALTKSRRARDKDVAPPDADYKDPKLPLHKLLDEAELTKLNKAFNREDGRRMDIDQLRKVLKKLANVEYDEIIFSDMFQKMNSDCNGYASWNEFISYLILGYQEEEVSKEYKTLEAPIPLPPTVFKSHHRHPLNRIAFYPTVKPNRTTSWQSGSIMTCSNDGLIHYWSLNMQLERKVQSTCPLLKVQPTWVMDMVVLPDVFVICTSSTERDLRFYDTSARKFELRVMVSSLPYAVTTMYYTFSTNINDPSKLILGDMGGNIKVISFNTEARGPFRSQPGIPLLHARYEAVMRGAISNFNVLEIPNVHTDYIRQVSYYPTLRGIVSCAESQNAVVISDVADGTTTYTYKIETGAWCFALEDVTHILATGGPDCLVRIWNPFVQKRPICTFYGHHTGIVQMVFQDVGKRMYSLSKDKCIKVWDIGLQSLLQTYIDLPSGLSEKGRLASLYNPDTRQWIIGSAMMAILPLSPEQSAEHTDGDTHTSGVSIVLYNKLFKRIVTCGLDSYILVWDPWDGRRLLVIKNAHTVMTHGKLKPVEIVAATFDPDFQRLLTGAHDGTLKIWNFNTGFCLRNMKIDMWSEIKCVIWVKNRMLVAGWNRRITEFADIRDITPIGGSESKNWSLRHTDDISSVVVRVPETLVTCSYSGELIFWSLETGQPYKQYNVAEPQDKIKLRYQMVKAKEKTKDELLQARRKSATLAAIKEKEKKPGLGAQKSYLAGPPVKQSKTKDQKSQEAESQEPQVSFNLRPLAIHCMLFLKTRKYEPETGTLLAAMENGVVQVWNHHPAGGFVAAFQTIHKIGDHVVALATDENNEFLFTGIAVYRHVKGTLLGYIKVWLLKNFCVEPEEEPPICMPKYRLMFPFLWGDTFVGRAMRAVKNQPKPVLLNSFKGHEMAVSSLTYIDECQIIVSCSADYSARMWTLGGRYLQTMGTFKPWKYVTPGKPINKGFEFGIPPEIKRSASSTTLRVLSGGSLPKRLTKKQREKRAHKNLVSVDESKIYGKPLTDPILGNFYNIPERTTKPRFVELDTSFPYIPVYQHLIMPKPVDIQKSDIIP